MHRSSSTDLIDGPGSKSGNIRRMFQTALAAHMSGNLTEALEHYHRLLGIRADHIPTLNNLGAIYLQSGHADRAEPYLRKAVALEPNNPDALNNLGIIHKASEDLETAAAFFTKAAALNPSDAEFQTNLGSVLNSLGHTEAAERCYQKALSSDPENPKALNNLAMLHKQSGKTASAISGLRKAIEHDPDDEQILFNLSNTLAESGKFEEAAAVSETARSRFPASITTQVGAARVFIESGHWEKADPIIASLIRYPFTPAHQGLLRHLLMFLNASAARPPEIARLHSIAGRFIEEAVKKKAGAKAFEFRHLPTAVKKLRIGYVSPDFNRHSVGYFFKEIIRYHDRSRFEVFCYSLSDQQDQVTREIREHADLFQSVRDLSPSDTAEKIHRDRVHILVDLSGYTRNNRLEIFAYKPAPVQLTAIGYPHGTGLCGMDYRLTDVYAEGPDAQSQYTETLIRMPGCFLPFPILARPDRKIERKHLGIPEGMVIFASFNAWHKLRPEVLTLWNQILTAAPNTSLVFSFRYAETAYARERIRSYFTINPERLHFLPQTETDLEHRLRYTAVDLALDPFPYNGTTTSWESLYMGTPVITLKGDRHAQRTTYSLLANLGLEKFAAEDGSSYLNTAVSLAMDPRRRSGLKRRLEEAVERVTRSGNAGYVVALEQRYRTIWHRYCQSRFRS